MVLRHCSAALRSGKASLVTGCDALTCIVSAIKQAVAPRKGSGGCACARLPVVLNPDTSVVIHHYEVSVCLSSLHPSIHSVIT